MIADRLFVPSMRRAIAATRAVTRLRFRGETAAVLATSRARAPEHDRPAAEAVGQWAQHELRHREPMR